MLSIELELTEVFEDHVAVPDVKRAAVDKSDGQRQQRSSLLCVAVEWKGLPTMTACDMERVLELPTKQQQTSLSSRRLVYDSFLYTQLVSRLYKLSTTLKRKVSIAPLPGFLVLAMKAIQTANKQRLSLEDKERISSEMANASPFWSELYGYQKEGVLFSIERGGKMLLLDEPGLGKTIQTVMVYLYYARDTRAIIVCPSVCQMTWFRELAQAGIDEKKISLVRKKTDLVAPDPDVQVVIVSFKLAVLHHDLLSPLLVTALPKKNASSSSSSSVPFSNHHREREEENGTSDSSENGKRRNTPNTAWRATKTMIVIDESHALKNYKSKQTTCLVPLIHKCSHAMLLSGTCLMRLKELYPQLNALLPAVFSNFFEYAKRYCNPKAVSKKKQAQFASKKRSRTGDTLGTRAGGAEQAERPIIMSYNGTTRSQELHIVLKHLFMLRRTKKQVLCDLPPKVRYKHYLEIAEESDEKEGEQDKSKKKTKKQGAAASRNDAKQKDGSEVDFMELVRRLAQKKIKPCLQFLKRHLRTYAGEKIVLFAHHQVVLNAVEEFLLEEEKNTKTDKDSGKHFYIRIDGSTNATLRQERIDYFQTSDACRIALLSMTAAGIGVTLTAAHRAIFLEMHADSSVLLQAEDRLHRISQEHKVTIIYLVVAYSIEETLWQLMQQKTRNLHQVVDGKSSPSS